MTTSIRTLIAAALLVVLTGCGSAPEPADTITVDEHQKSLLDQITAEEEQAESPWVEKTDEFTKTMKDGREVQCLVIRFYDSASLECDFATARYPDDTEVTP